MTTKRKKIDWERAQNLYRTGQLSDNEIANIVGCGQPGLRKRAKTHNWRRDLSKQVREATRAELARDGSDATDSDVVREAAAVAAEVVRDHRKQLRKGRALVEQMFDDLGLLAVKSQEIEAALMAAMEGDEHAVADALRALKVPVRATTLNQLANALTKVVNAERIAFNLDEERSEKPYEQSLRELADDNGEGNPAPTA